ncbi:CotH kinase family protein [Klebsiella quasipneumoniae]|nr:CotH kinase family protein [Klebsiella quasipneumoniae]MBO3251176.1 CotH kinase family protein [Klebsiella quasipneumoniae]
MAFNPELGSTSPAVLLDNAERLDKLVNGPELTEPDRAGVELDTWRGMMAKNDEIRQNLIPLSKQYATLAAAQADIVNIPEGSTTYYRSPDDSALAVEVINNAGTLQPTGRKMPSQQAVDDIEEQTQQATDWLQRIYLGQQIQAETQSQITKDNENAITALQHISLSLQVISEIIFSQENILNESQNNISHINTAIQVLSETLFSLGVSDSQTRNTIQSLSTSLQIVIDAINLAPSARDLDGARLQSLLNLSLLASELYKLDGLDTNATGGGGSAGATEVTDGIYAFPSPARIVRIDITSPQGVPASKADGTYQGRCKIDIDGVSLTAFSTIAVQGSSSAGYPKKNLTIAFYSDEAYSTDLKLKIGDGLAFSEWVYKANYIDSTHSRNLIGYTLWTQMQNTRDTWPRREVDHYYVGKTGLAAVDTGATGIPKGYPCIVYINSEFYGVGDIMIGKKRANYNIAKNIPEQIYLEFQNCDIRTLDISNPDICEVTAPSNVTATVNGYLDVWRTFAQLPQSDFSAALPEHMDKMNTSDYYILMMFLCAVDCFNKNMLFMTWDAQKWFCMPYDLDTTFGLNASGRAIAYGPTLNPITQGFALPGNREFWGKVYTAIGSDINARYAQLRNSGVLSVGNVSRIMTALQSKYTIDMFERELIKWTGLPSKDITSNDQLLSWLTQRMVWLDQYFSYE